jgi:hypothetical protein
VPDVKRPKPERRTDGTLLQPHAKNVSKPKSTSSCPRLGHNYSIAVVIGCYFPPTMRFLHLIRPVMCVLPEVASPDRKVRQLLTQDFVGRVTMVVISCRFVAYTNTFLLPLSNTRSPFAKSFFGRPLSSSSFWYVARSHCMGSSRPSHPIPSIGSVWCWPPTAAR